MLDEELLRFVQQLGLGVNRLTAVSEDEYQSYGCKCYGRGKAMRY